MSTNSNARASIVAGEKPRRRPWRSLDDDLIARIADFVKVCGSIPTACAACDVAWPTARYWIKQGKKGVEPYASFLARCKEAQALREIGLHGVVLRAAKKNGDWRAAMAELNRMEWSRRASARNAPPPVPDEQVIFMYPVRVAEGGEAGGVRLEQLAPPEPVRDAFDTDGEDITDDE